MGKGQSIAGRKVNTPTDFYETPTWATEALLDVESFKGGIWEPASGHGAISRVLMKRYSPVISTDIMPDGYGACPMDFFEQTAMLSGGIYAGRTRNIVTNPPYRYAQEFVGHAIKLLPSRDFGDGWNTNSVPAGKAAFLLKLTFLESTKRKTFFETYPPKKVWVFSKRVTMYPHGEPEPKNGGTIAYAWFVWQKGYTGQPEIGWI